MYSSSALRLLCASHCQLCVGSSLPDSHCAPQFAQLSIPDVFYKLQPSFSRVPAAVIVPESYRAHSTKNRLRKVSCNKNLGSINNFNDFKAKVMSQEYNHSTPAILSVSINTSSPSFRYHWLILFSIFHNQCQMSPANSLALKLQVQRENEIKKLLEFENITKLIHTTYVNLHTRKATR